MIAIVDYGAGNLNSVKKAFAYLGAEVVVTAQPETVAAADKIVLPGVGHFSSLQSLNRTGLREVVVKSACSGKPFLGICLGMQWLFDGSEECLEVAGAGIFPGICQRFPFSVKSPHVGWNSLAIQKGSRLLHGIAQDSFVYYTHSFHAPAIAATTAAHTGRAQQMTGEERLLDATIKPGGITFRVPSGGCTQKGRPGSRRPFDALGVGHN